MNNEADITASSILQDMAILNGDDTEEGNVDESTSTLATSSLDTVDLSKLSETLNVDLDSLQEIMDELFPQTTVTK